MRLPQLQGNRVSTANCDRVGVSLWTGPLLNPSPPLEEHHDNQVATGQPPATVPSHHPSRPDVPDDLEPLPDGMYQEPYFTETVQIVRTIFASEPAVLVSGDTPIYYDDEEERQRIVRPDCYVTFDVDTAAIMRRNGYFMRWWASRRDSPWKLLRRAPTPKTWGASGTSTPGWA